MTPSACSMEMLRGASSDSDVCGPLHGKRKRGPDLDPPGTSSETEGQMFF